MENNLKRKKEQRLIEKMERLKKIKKILEMSEKRIDKNNKSREKKHSENKNSDNKNRHNSVCGDIFQINLFNTASSKNIKKNFKKSASMCVKTIDIDSIKENNETTWQVDLVVKPTKNLYKLIIVIILMIVIMTFYAVRLQMKEREEDNIENKETFAPWFG